MLSLSILILAGILPSWTWMSTLLSAWGSSVDILVTRSSPSQSGLLSGISDSEVATFPDFVVTASAIMTLYCCHASSRSMTPSSMMARWLHCNINFTTVSCSWMCVWSWQSIHAFIWRFQHSKTGPAIWFFGPLQHPILQPPSWGKSVQKHLKLKIMDTIDQSSFLLLRVFSNLQI